MKLPRLPEEEEVAIVAENTEETVEETIEKTKESEPDSENVIATSSGHSNNKKKKHKKWLEHLFLGDNT